MTLLELLGIGSENARTAKELGKLLNLESRTVMQEIHNLRIQGNLICANQHGLFKPKTIEDVKKFVACMESRQRQIGLATAPAIDYLKKIQEEQEESDK